MNDIDNLTKQEKSVLLAKAMGKPLWIIRIDVAMMGIEDSTISNLYHPANMALAFRTFYWFYHNTKLARLLLDRWSIYNLMGNPVEEIVPVLLDDILSLVIEAGLVELEEEKE